ncbi:MAG: hypothetical protein OXC26_00210 [Albidovulum sp.]|nr:hypothetical protein [Albidovulum sp.]
MRNAVVVEGQTDEIVLEAILSAEFPDADPEIQTLQPEGSRALGFKSFSDNGYGWGGVYRWIDQAVQERGGSISGCSVLDNFDMIIVQVDADVAHKSYGEANIQNPSRNDLPCCQPCPPASDTTNSLHSVILGWLGQDSRPENVVLCTPSKSMDTWVLAAVCPENQVVQREEWECNLEPSGQLGTLPKSKRFKKSVSDFRRLEKKVAENWHVVVERFSEAAKFKADLQSSSESCTGRNEE